MKTEFFFVRSERSMTAIADAESEANTKRKPVGQAWNHGCLPCTGSLHRHRCNAIRSNATAGTFTMDVNPSVEYTIAKKRDR